MFKHFSWVQLPKRGAIGIGLFASLFLVSAIQSPASSQTADGTSAIEDSFFEDEGEDDLGNAFEGNLEDGLDENLRIASFSVTTTSQEDTNSPIARFLTSRGSSGCRWTTNGNIGRNAFGASIFGYFQEIYHCWNGSRVTFAQRQNRWGDVYLPLVEFVGHTQDWRNGNTFWTQGHFRTCLGWNGIGCFFNYYPVVRQWPTGFGNVSLLYRSVQLPSSENEDNDIFFSNDLDESTKAELMTLINSSTPIENGGTNSATSVPEPTTLAGLALIGAMLLASKRFRFAKQHPEEAENVTDTTAVEIQ